MTNLLKNRRLESFLMLILIAVLVLSASPALAEDGEKSWQPPPPMPDKFDWIQLTSGEWLKGKITAMYDEKLEFDSKELDELTIDWEDIKEIRSAGTMQIGFQHDVVATGQLLIEGNTVRVMGEEDQSYSRSDLLTITAGAPKEINYWSGKLTLGANYRRGNTDQVELSTEANFKRRTPKNRVNFDYLGIFNRTFGEVAADNQRVNAGWNRYFSKRFFWSPVYGEYYRDPFQNIASRWTLGMGVGYTLIDTKKTDWEISGGLAYQTTQFDDVLEGESDSADTPALQFGTVYDYDITKDIDFIFDYRFFIVNEESGTYTHHMLTSLEFEITKLLDFDITLVWDRIQNPREDSTGITPEQDDFRLMFGLGIDF
jgi:hypothetical protein